jgi:ABC-type uncharacterized transport system auxiliary subunit
LNETLQKLLAAFALAALLAGCAPFTNNGTPYPPTDILGSD